MIHFYITTIKLVIIIIFNFIVLLLYYDDFMLLYTYSLFHFTKHTFDKFLLSHSQTGEVNCSFPLLIDV